MLELKLFGRFEATVDGSPLRRLRTHRGQAVLAYLGVNAGKPVERATLASTVWPFSDPSDALYSLRRTLTDLRQALGASASALVSPSSASLMLDPTRALIDVARFQELAEESAGACRASELYRGDLLEGWNEDWIPPYRSNLAITLRECLIDAVRAADKADDPKLAAEALRRLLTHEPHNEEVLRMAMERLAKAGEPAVAWNLYESFRRRLQDDLGFAVSDETTRAAEEIANRARSAKAEAPVVARGYIPPFETSLVGRSEELTQLEKLLASRGLVTLLGLGGIGKTRLSVEVARRIEHGFSAGAWLVPLAAVREPREATLALAAALRPLDPEPQGPAAELAMRLSHVSALVLLDNCEHVIEPVREACRLFRAHCPNVRILATSQQPIGTEGEQVFPVPVLEVSHEDGQISPSEQLFFERAVAANPRLLLTPEIRAAIERICRRLEGIPLAIELAASRVRYLDPVRLDELLCERFELLNSPAASRDPRHSTLEATLAWSFEHLNEEERYALMAAATFAGAWSVDDLAKLMKDGSPLTAVRSLESLVDRSLIVEAESGIRPRFRLLGPVRRYALMRAQEEGLTPELQRKHTDAILELCDLFTKGSSVGKLEETQAQMTAMEDEISEVFNRADSLGNTEDALKVTATTWFYFWNRGWLQLGRARAERAVLLPNADTFGQLYWDAVHVSGLFAWGQADYEVAKERISRALDGYRSIAYDEGCGRAMANLGQVLRNQGLTFEAEAMHRKVIEIWGRLNHFHRLCLSHVDLAMCAYEQCRFAESLPLYEAAAEIARMHDLNMPWIAIDINLGQSLHELGRYEEADAAFQRALDKANEQNVVVMQTMARLYRSYLQLSRGDYREAAPVVFRGLEAFIPIGEKRGLMLHVEALGLIATQSGEIGAGGRLLGAAEAMRSSLGIVRTPIDRIRCDRHTETARSAEFEDAIAIGRTLSREQVLEVGRTVAERMERQSPAGVAVTA